jgi:hypothetical protein
MGSPGILADIRSRLAGFYLPDLDEAWKPPESDIETVQELFTFLNERRVLSGLSRSESLRDSKVSIRKISKSLEEKFQAADAGTPLALSLQAMLAACHEFLDHTRGIKSDRDFSHRMKVIDSRYCSEARAYYLSLGRLRTLFGFHITLLSAQYGVEVPARLTITLPRPVEGSSAA